MSLTPATCVVSHNPFAPDEAKASPVAAGTRIADLAPKVRAHLVCRLDGAWILRKDWERSLLPGQVVEFHAYPMGGGDNGEGSDATRTIVTIAAVYLAVTYGAAYLEPVFGSYAPSAAAFLATALVNKLIPPGVGNEAVTNSTASPSYSTALSGNQSRLEQPIPVLYGRNKTYPDFAAEPYSVFDTNDDQFYYALLCLGQGEYDIEAKLIDDTPTSSFADVTLNILPPGALPTVVEANVVTSPEVAGNSLDGMRYAGGFVGCRARQKATSISIDIGFSRGLASYNATTGEPEFKTVTWRVEYREVDDFGRARTNWVTLATPTLTLAQTRPVRRTYTYALPRSARPEVRLIRQTAYDDNSRVANSLEWLGLRCSLVEAAPLCATATHVEIRLRATEQLNGLSQRKIAIISRRKLRTWHPDTEWGALVATRNPAWALADKWTNTVYGDGYEDERIDLESLYRLALVWDARQDRFDAVFDQTFDSFAADQTIANAGRAAVFRRNGRMTLVRDQLNDLPRTSYSSRNIQPGSLSIDYALATEATPDGVLVEYWDNRAWAWYEILCPCPGVASPVRPHRIKLFGVTGATHAEREGLYQAYNSFYRRKFPSFSTEMEGMLPAFGSAVVFSPSLPGWGAGGDIVEYDPEALTLVLSEPPAWEDGQVHYLSLVRLDGSLSSPIVVTPGADKFTVQLSEGPVDTLFHDVSTLERPRYTFGVGQAYPTVLRVTSIQNSQTEGGAPVYNVAGVIENDLVHTADLHLLPVDGEVQDDVDFALDPPSLEDPDDPEAPAGDFFVYLADDPGDSTAVYGTQSDEVQLLDTGKLLKNLVVYDSLHRPQLESTELPAQWLVGSPYTPAETALYEVQAVVLDGSSPTGSALNSWLSLGTTRAWKISAIGAGASDYCVLQLNIREAATEVLQASASYVLTANDIGV